MNTELKSINQAVEVIRSRLLDLKNQCASDPAKLNRVADTELALGWMLGRLKKLNTQLEVKKTSETAYFCGETVQIGG